MKRGTTPTLQVLLSDIEVGYVSYIDFMFKQQPQENCQDYVLKKYPSSEVALDSTYTGGNLFLVSFTEEDTRKFIGGKKFYLDVRPVLTNGKVLETELVSLEMNSTLFSEEES